MTMEFDDLLTNHLGEFGRYQIIIFCLVSITSTTFAFTNIGIIFVAGVPEHWCSVSELQQYDLSDAQQQNLSIPLKATNDDKEIYSSCKMYER